MHLPHHALLLIASLFAAGTVGAGCKDDASAPETRVRTAPSPPSAVAHVPLKERRRIYADLARIRDRGVGDEAALKATAQRHSISVAVVRSIAREGALQDWPLPPAPRLPRAPLLPPSRNTSATHLAATVNCSEAEPRKGIAVLRWKPATHRGSEQRVVVTIFRNFEEGNFESSGPLSPRRAKLEWHRVHGQAIHSWRVLTQQHGGWVLSKVGRYTGPICLADARTNGPVP
jgi:hypothetical protein